MSGGNGIFIDSNSAYNSVSFSTITSLTSNARYSGYYSSGSYNSVTQSNFSGYFGAVLAGSNAKFNNISYSTMSSASGLGFYVNQASSNTVVNNYIAGPTAVYVNASTFTFIGGSILTAADPAGFGLYLTGGSRGLFLATSTLSGGINASAIYLGAYNSGKLELSSNNVTGGGYGLNIATQAAGVELQITSMTFSPLTAGTTAINFLGGTFVSTFSGVSFNSSNIAVNVDASRLDPASRITMLAYYGSKAGPSAENDPNGLVDWPCQLITSEGTGNWSDPAIWSQGYVPMTCSPVTITAGNTVILDAMNAVSSGAVINGTLTASRAASSSWTLTAGDINVNPGGTLDYGTEASPLPAGTTAHLVLSSGSFAGQYGLIVNDGGNFTVRGATKTPYAFATADLTIGQTNLTVYGSTSVAGWQSGDVITIGPTTGNGVAATSSRTITTIDTAGLVYIINWTEGLETARTLTGDAPILVANLTRNVLVRSSGTDVAANSAYISNLAQNATSFSLTHGEFAYLGANAAGKYGITFDGALTKGSISSSTARNGYAGIYFNNSSSNTLTGNNLYSNSGYGINLYNSSNNNTLTGNNSCSNINFSYSILLDNSSNNTLTGNNSYSNLWSGIYLYNSSSNNTLTGNNSYSNFYGIYIYNSSNNNTLTGNNFYSNSGYGIYLWSSSSNNTFTGNNSYSNSYGIFAENSSDNTFIGGNMGYNATGVSLKNSAEIGFASGGDVETLVLKDVRVNPAGTINTTGMNTAGSALISYNQNSDTGTVRIWGNYRVAGSTLTLDHSSPLYRASNTEPKLMRGTGHSVTVTDLSDTYAVSQLITIHFRPPGVWQVDGSSSGANMQSFSAGGPWSVPGSNPQFKITLTEGGSPQFGDSLDFVLTGWSKDSGFRKKLLFGPGAASFNQGRSKLEVDPTGGIVLRGMSDGSANTLVDWLGASSTYYTFVDSGAFTVEYASFTNMDPGGIQLSGSGGVAISSSTFDYLGFASGTNSYISARDLNSNATLNNVTFGLSRSSAGFASAYNVRVENPDAGLNWSFTNPSGFLWGEKYDSDPNGKVAWINCGALTSAQTGPWSDLETWNPATVPSACNTVTVAANHVVTVDMMTAVSSTATIYGTVQASRLVSSSWTLVSGDINVNAGGTLDYGTEASPLPAGTTAHLVLAYGASAGQYGLIVNNGGNLTVRGSTKTPYSFATQSISAANYFTVYGSTSTEGWQIGDVITIGPTSGNGVTSTSSRTIKDVTHGAGSNTVEFSGAALSRTLTSETPIIVGNLTRNVLVRSSGTAVTAGGNSAYILNLAQNATSFALTYGEFAYLGVDAMGKEGITFKGALTHGTISSSTIRNGYRGIDLWNSSNNILTGNNSYSNLSVGILIEYLSSNNTLTGNNSYSNSSHGIYFSDASSNTLTGNNAYSNQQHGITLSGSSNNTLAWNSSYSNSSDGISLNNSSNNNTFSGNRSYTNAHGLFLAASSGNTLNGNNVYSNSAAGAFIEPGANGTVFLVNNFYSNGTYGLRLFDSINNTFSGGNIGYDGTGASKPDSLSEIYFEPIGNVKTLVLKGARINPDPGISRDGMNRDGTSLLSYNQDADTGTVRIWGNYQVAGSTLTLDYAAQLYASTATAGKLMRGTGHSIGITITNDAYTLSELITVTYKGSSEWRIEGSSSGVLNDSFSCPLNTTVGFTHNKVNFGLTAGPAPAVGDMLDLVTIAASSVTNRQK
ncbi:MAG: NosD domain-containing protein, partial [Elusimicrobiota bacterium]|nr:NosD domain-containing protein [Elusimicrobiota bacterium]